MKTFLLTTPLAWPALSARSMLDLVRNVFSRTEFVGALANDRIATRLVAGIVDPGKVFVDVGAHIGSITAAVARHVPRARIVAVEADPHKARDLARNFPAVKVHPCAAGRSNGEADFYIRAEASGYSSLLVPAAAAGAADTQPIRVPIRTLDDLLADEDVDVVKIDVEGAELEALQGATRTIARCRPLVMLESGTPLTDEPWATIDAVHGYFDAIDYDLVLPNHLAHNSPGLDAISYRQGHWHPRVTTNYFAVPRERRPHYRDRARRTLGWRGTRA